MLHLKPQLGEVETELARLSAVEPWASQMTYLVQLPGIGMLTAMTTQSVGAIGDISRFPAAKKLGGYAGLGPEFTPPARPTKVVLSPKPVLSLSKEGSS